MEKEWSFRKTSLARKVITIFNMALEGKIFPAVQTNVKDQRNTIIAVDSEC